MFWLNTGQKLKQSFNEPNRTKALFDFIQYKFQHVQPILTLPFLADKDEDIQKENFNQNAKANEELEQNITAVQYAKAEDILSESSKEDCTIIEENLERNIHRNSPPIKKKNEYSYFSPRFGHNFFSSLQKNLPYFDNYLSVQFADFNKFLHRMKDQKNDEQKTEDNSDIDSDDEGSDIPNQNLKKKKLHSRCIANPISRKLVRKFPSSSSSSHHYVLKYHTPQSKTPKERNLFSRRTHPIKNFYSCTPSVHHEKSERQPLIEIVRKTHAKYRQEYSKHIAKPKHDQQSRQLHKYTTYETDNNNISLSKVKKICKSHKKRHHTVNRPSLESIGDSDFLTSIDYTKLSEPHTSKSYVDYALKLSRSSMLRMNSAGANKQSKHKLTATDSKIEILNKLIHICSDEGRPLFPGKGEKHKRPRIKVMTPADGEAYERLKKITVRQTQGSSLAPTSTKRIENFCEKSMGSKTQRIVTQQYETIKEKKNSRPSSSKSASKEVRTDNGSVIKKRCILHANVGVDNGPILMELESRNTINLNESSKLVLGSNKQNPNNCLYKNETKKYVKEKCFQVTQESLVPNNNSIGSVMELSKLSTSKNSLFSLKDSYPYFGMSGMGLIFDIHNGSNTYFPIIQSKIIIFNNEATLLNIANDLLKLNDSAVASIYFNHQMYNISEQLAHKCLKNYLRRKCGKYLYRRKYRKNRKYYLLYK
ncbi:uncharacterized protein LOC123293840 [Chrysoperla carnea]|uniref:uncharacterized protein LOC123293840 n=1 Tax=Chrysoperla carnea TaxID=189513 RepID=UPI001D08A5F5|nr:uncharacterized protein LOC123293840 [Chrysoperla carnea]